MMTAATTVRVTLVSPDEDAGRFSRRLAAITEGGPMMLARVLAVGTQEYPTHPDAPRGRAAVLCCEFHVQHAGSAINDEAVSDLVRRLGQVEFLEITYVDARGNQVGAGDTRRAAS